MLQNPYQRMPYAQLAPRPIMTPLPGILPTPGLPGTYQYHQSMGVSKIHSYNQSIPVEIQGFVPISYDIPPPIRMRERFDFYQNLVREGDFVLVETPDLYEFANDLDVIRNKD